MACPLMSTSRNQLSHMHHMYQRTSHPQQTFAGRYRSLQIHAHPLDLRNPFKHQQEPSLSSSGTLTNVLKAALLIPQQAAAAPLWSCYSSSWHVPGILLWENSPNLAGKTSCQDIATWSVKWQSRDLNPVLICFKPGL